MIFGFLRRQARYCFCFNLLAVKPTVPRFSFNQFALCSGCLLWLHLHSFRCDSSSFWESVPFVLSCSLPEILTFFSLITFSCSVFSCRNSPCLRIFSFLSRLQLRFTYNFTALIFKSFCNIRYETAKPIISEAMQNRSTILFQVSQSIMLSYILLSKFINKTRKVSPDFINPNHSWLVLLIHFRLPLSRRRVIPTPKNQTGRGLSHELRIAPKF